MKKFYFLLSTLIFTSSISVLGAANLNKQNSQEIALSNANIIEKQEFLQNSSDLVAKKKKKKKKNKQKRISKKELIYNHINALTAKQRWKFKMDKPKNGIFLIKIDTR